MQVITIWLHYSCSPTHTCTHGRRNVLPDAEKLFLETCRFNKSNINTTYCPIFSLQQIVDMIHHKDGEKENFTKLSIQVRDSLSISPSLPLYFSLLSLLLSLSFLSFSLSPSTSTQGGVVGLEIQWNCDHLERGIAHCNPEYSAKR